MRPYDPAPPAPNEDRDQSPSQTDRSALESLRRGRRGAASSRPRAGDDGSPLGMEPVKNAVVRIVMLGMTAAVKGPVLIEACEAALIGVDADRNVPRTVDGIAVPDDHVSLFGNVVRPVGNLNGIDVRTPAPGVDRVAADPRRADHVPVVVLRQVDALIAVDAIEIDANPVVTRRKRADCRQLMSDAAAIVGGAHRSASAQLPASDWRSAQR